MANLIQQKLSGGRTLSNYFERNLLVFFSLSLLFSQKKILIIIENLKFKSENKNNLKMRSKINRWRYRIELKSKSSLKHFSHPIDEREKCLISFKCNNNYVIIIFILIFFWFFYFLKFKNKNLLINEEIIHCECKNVSVCVCNVILLTLK